MRSDGTSYRVAVSVSRFDGVLGQSVVLKARWELTVQSGGREEALGVKEGTITETVTGADYDALVAAMQRALIRFGQEIGDGIIEAKRVARARRLDEESCNSLRGQVGLNR